MTYSEPIKAPPRPTPPEHERISVRPEPRDHEKLRKYFKGDAISFAREARRKELQKEGNPVLLSTDDSEGLFKKEDVKPITSDEPLDMPMRRRGSVVAELETRMMKEMGWNNYMGRLRKKRKKSKKVNKAKKDKQTKKVKKVKKDKKSKKAKKKSSK